MSASQRKRQIAHALRMTQWAQERAAGTASNRPASDGALAADLMTPHERLGYEGGSYLVTDQPFTCPRCGARTEAQPDGRERCPVDGLVYTLAKR